ncbi:unnamed protein product [Meganyctiphanes norvegica]|uniref:RGS domain-containing protein n=1 Tax=Meganyctiphanes norvegica TaxID=48144 RepID=A0AAV2RCV8_MEGNR
MTSTTLQNPTRQQCDQWQISLNKALEDPDGFQNFYAFLKSFEEYKGVTEGEYTRYLDFWSDCQIFKNTKFDNYSEAKQSALQIFNTYLNTRAEKKLDLGGYDHIVPKTRELLQVENSEDVSSLLNVFDEALSGMRQNLNEGGCGGAYDKWKIHLQPKDKKKNKSCRLL